MPVRILKDVEFNNWAVEYGVNDEMLRTAAREIETGLIDARLGGFLIKKRVAAPGKGKRGSFRTILGYRHADRLVFIHGFAKNETDNVSRKEKEALRKLCDIYMQADEAKLTAMIEQEKILEIVTS